MWRATALEMLPPMLLHWMCNVRTVLLFSVRLLRFIHCQHQSFNVLAVELNWNCKSVYPSDSLMEYFGQLFCKKF